MQLMQDGASEHESEDEQEQVQQQNFGNDGGPQGELVRKAQEMMQD